MYSILLKDSKNGMFRFLTVQREIMKEEPHEIIDPETNEVRTETTLIPTGEYETVKFEVETRDELEQKCISLLSTYNIKEFTPIHVETFNIDLTWPVEGN